LKPLFLFFGLPMIVKKHWSDSHGWGMEKFKYKQVVYKAIFVFVDS
jgi:hypothetical protein